MPTASDPSYFLSRIDWAWRNGIRPEPWASMAPVVVFIRKLLVKFKIETRILSLKIG